MPRTPPQRATEAEDLGLGLLVLCAQGQCSYRCYKSDLVAQEEALGTALLGPDSGCALVLSGLQHVTLDLCLCWGGVALEADRDVAITFHFSDTRAERIWGNFSPNLMTKSSLSQPLSTRGHMPSRVAVKLPGSRLLLLACQVTVRGS